MPKCQDGRGECEENASHRPVGPRRTILLARWASCAYNAVIWNGGPPSPARERVGTQVVKEHGP